MSEDFDEYPQPTLLSRISHYFNTIPPIPRAVIIFILPFIFTDFWNYYSAGATLALSAPILCLIYMGCGALAAQFANGQGNRRFAFNGAASGALLWLASTLVNTLISLIIGTASLGTTLLLGIPYLCLCTPFSLLLGGLVGALGGTFYSWLQRHKPGYESPSEYH